MVVDLTYSFDTMYPSMVILTVPSGLEFRDTQSDIFKAAAPQMWFMRVFIAFSIDGRLVAGIRRLDRGGRGLRAQGPGPK